jgi:hypothetical protein
MKCEWVQLVGGGLAFLVGLAISIDGVLSGGPHLIACGLVIKAAACGLLSRCGLGG